MSGSDVLCNVREQGRMIAALGGVSSVGPTISGVGEGGILVE